MTTTIDYSFGVSLNYPDRMCVRVDAGIYKHTVFSVAKLYYDEEKSDFVCNYDVEYWCKDGKEAKSFDLAEFSEIAVRPIMLDFLQDIAQKTLDEKGKPQADAL